MDGINKKYNLEIEVLTPLSIGAGQEKDWTRGIDFVVNNGSLYKLNLKKMLREGVNPDELSSYFATKNELGLIRKFAGRLEAVSDAIIPLPIQSDNDVKAFVKNQLNGEPVLTGSSLKGAIRSVLFQYLGGDSKDGREVFGSPTDGDEFMRFIKISDAEFDETSLVNTKIFNLRKVNNEWLGGWKDTRIVKKENATYSETFTNKDYNSVGFNTLYECLMPQQKGHMAIMMASSIYDKYESEKKRHHIKAEKKSPILHEDISTLFCIINKHTEEYLLKEKDFFETYATNKTDVIIRSIDSLLDQIPSDNSYCVLKMSAGSGFHSITGDWQFKDYSINGLDTSRKVSRGLFNEDKSAKSRKIADWDNNLSLMGFVKLTPDDVVRKHEEQEAQAQREQEARQAQYNAAIAEVKQLIDAEQYEMALDKFQSASALFPKGKQSEIDADLLKEKVASFQEKRAVEQNQREEAERRRQENAIPLSEKIAKAQKIPTLCGNVKTWMKQNGVDSLDDDNLQVIFDKVKDIVSQMKPKDQAKLSGLGKDVESLVGTNTASRWFHEITNN